MIAITLPDDSIREFPNPPTGLEIAASIGKGLAKAAVAIDVGGEMLDLSRVIEQDSRVAIITRDDPRALDLLRHDAAHVMAQAVQELYPDTQVTIGPSIEDGFYYDFARETPFTPEDLQRIERRMHDIVARDDAIVREEWDRQEAVEHFASIGETYKAQIIRDLPQSETITVYRQGDWKDLCRGPHLPSTGRLGRGFKLMKLAGAYWRGDSNNEMLQRIYGTAWSNEKQLKEYLFRLEEAERRDHRKLGRQMDLFHLQEDAPGAVFWHPKGWRLIQTLTSYMRQRQEDAGYDEVNTPELMDRSMWEASGHWETYHENMFTSQTEDGRVFAIKPMNCPGHVQIFKQGITSYRELPVRISEFGKVHRYEPSGALHGLMRVRGFCQDDAHIFCTEDQITAESIGVCDLILSIYRDFGFDDVRIKFADRPEKRVGEDAVWDKSEAALREACTAAGVELEYNPGEGAFYGPKLEFVLRDAIGREWQCGTLQVDLNLPQRLGAEYIDEDGEKRRPVMLHRAMFGSLERFTGILVEHYAGNLPLWLAPVQTMVCSVVTEANDYAAEVLAQLKAAGLLAQADYRNETVSYKIRQHSVEKVPVILVVGKREAEQQTVAMRRLGSKQQKEFPLADAIARLKAEAEHRLNVPLAHDAPLPQSPAA